MNEFSLAEWGLIMAAPSVLVVLMCIITCYTTPSIRGCTCYTLSSDAEPYIPLNNRRVVQYGSPSIPSDISNVPNNKLGLSI